MLKAILRRFIVREPKSPRKPMIVSGLFGTEFKTVHPSLPTYRCVLISNNESLRFEAEEKGWEFRMLTIPGMELTSDLLLSSIQSKYVKFMMFSSDFPEYFTGQPILYVDHKIHLREEDVLFIQKSIPEEKSLLVINTPRLKSKITDEIDDAMNHARYRMAMPETLVWLEHIKGSRGIQESVRIMATGLIYYQHLHSVRGLLDECHEVVQHLNQPECQIIWAALSQPYESLIQRVDWSEISIKHELPL